MSGKQVSIILTTEEQETLNSVKKYAEYTLDMLREYSQYSIDLFNDVHISTMSSNMLWANETVKSLEGIRKKCVAPHLQEQKNINAFFKPFIAVLEEVKQKAKAFVFTYEQHKEEQRLLALQNARDMPKSEALLLASPREESAIRIEKRWAFEVTDITEVPIELLIVDTTKIEEIIANSNPETLNIPGLRFFQVDRPVIKR